MGEFFLAADGPSDALHPLTMIAALLQRTVTAKLSNFCRFLMYYLQAEPVATTPNDVQIEAELRLRFRASGGGIPDYVEPTGRSTSMRKVDSSCIKNMCEDQGLLRLLSVVDRRVMFRHCPTGLSYIAGCW